MNYYRGTKGARESHIVSSLTTYAMKHHCPVCENTKINDAWCNDCGSLLTFSYQQDNKVLKYGAQVTAICVIASIVPSIAFLDRPIAEKVILTLMLVGTIVATTLIQLKFNRSSYAVCTVEADWPHKDQSHCGFFRTISELIGTAIVFSLGLYFFLFKMYPGVADEVAVEWSLNLGIFIALLFFVAYPVRILAIRRSKKIKTRARMIREKNWSQRN